MKHCTDILFDLDGTLSDPSVGITESLAYALEKVGAVVPPAHELVRYIGPPLQDTFRKLADAQKADEALLHYRHRYDDEGAMFHNTLFDELPALLGDLRQCGKRLFVATSKPHEIAKKIIRHFELDVFFITVHGAEMDGTRCDKGELIAYVCQQENIRPENAVMIGDRKHDVIGAQKNQMRSIGVLWGFGDEAELRQAGAHALAATPAHLRALLLPS